VSTDVSRRTFLAASAMARTSRPHAAVGNAEHAVIFVIDGLSYKAVERLNPPNLRSLIAAGTYYRKSYNIAPLDPTDTPNDPASQEWMKYQASSLPNPVILAGTVLLRTDQHYVQESFFPDSENFSQGRVTAHAANDVAYRRLNAGFHLSFLKGSDDNQVPDSETMYWALEFLRKERPAFMKIHLQHTGNAGWICSRETSPSVPWRRNIWGEGSPYRKTALRADQYVGQFVEELRKLGIWDKTVLFVTADHGQLDEGGHPPYAEDSWAMPLVVTGPGIRSSQRFDYAEQIDMVPTLCYLMGVKPPANADGRILAEALQQPPADVPASQRRMNELNILVRDGDALLTKLRKQARKSPTLQARLAAAEKEYYGLDRILHWNRFGTVDNLMAHNRGVLKALSDLV
jgi:hypothetical protein